jgi:hypothetical protein
MSALASQAARYLFYWTQYFEIWQHGKPNYPSQLAVVKATRTVKVIVKILAMLLMLYPTLVKASSICLLGCLQFALR